MPLGDVSRLSLLSTASARRLGDRLVAIGLTQAFMKPIFGVGERLDDPLRSPMRIWTLRQTKEARAVLARVLMFGDVASRDDLAAALGSEEALRSLLDCGLLVATRDDVVSPFRLDIAFDRYFLSDPLSAGGDAVMGPSATTGQLALAARPESRVRTVLDLGCGAGVLAVALADRADRVIATDINPRAAALAALNAAMNGADNVEVRVGDLTAPVAGDTFDLVVCQPPFVGLPDSMARPSFLFGGARGDELAMRAVAEAVPLLTPCGVGLFLVDWALSDGLSFEHRVREVVPDTGVNLLVVSSPPRALEDHCTLYAAGMEPELGSSFATAALAMRDHFAALGVRGLSLSLLLVSRTGSGNGFTRTVNTKPFAAVPPVSSVLWRLTRALSALAGGLVAVGHHTAAIAPGVLFEPIPGAGAIVRPPPESIFPPWGVDGLRLSDLQLAAWARDLFSALEVAENPARMLETVALGVARGALVLTGPEM